MFRADVEAVILRCLEKDREHRWASIGELALPWPRTHRSPRGCTSRAPTGQEQRGYREVGNREPGGKRVRAARGLLARHDTLDPAEAASRAPRRHWLRFSSGAAAARGNTELVGTTGFGQAPANRILWIALALAFSPWLGWDS